MIQIGDNHQLLVSWDDYERSPVKFFSDFGTFSDELNGSLERNLAERL